MASETTDSEDQAEASHEPRECMPCRGSGTLVSNLGGAPANVKCPWCEGTGMRRVGVDAQAGWPANEVPEAPPEPAAEPAAPPA